MTDGPAQVSAREAEVLAAIADHRSNAQIAHTLHISVRTVESHVSSLLRKYGVTDRRELADLVNPPAPATPPGQPPGFAGSPWAGTGPAGGSAGSPLAGPGPVTGSAGSPWAGPGPAGGSAGLPSPGPAVGIAGLPVGRTSFVGRSDERAALTAALGESRLVTLLGPGGMGKTRLATVVASDLADGVGGAFVDLVPVREGLVARAVAAALGVTEQPPQSLEQAITERLRTGRSLLVLDNCEQVVDEVAVLAELLLAACPGLTVLATSRERLGVPGERTIPLQELSEAVQLFRDRASSVDAEFALDDAVLTELCAGLDGMPLAIELAAARAGSLGVDGLRSALDDQLRLLAGGRGTDARHRSLRSVIGWSHDLLDDAERMLFRRLSVFAGGFDLDAACATSPELGRGEVADLAGRLADKSLTVRHGTRWRMLENIRLYAAEQLAPELPTIQPRYLRWAATTASRLESLLDTPTPPARPTGDPTNRPTNGPTGGPTDPFSGRGLPPSEPDGGAEGAWAAELGEVVSDLRGALAGTASEPDAVAHRLARSLAHLMFARRDFVEARAHYLAAADRAEDPVAAAYDLRSAADTALAVADGNNAVDHLLTAADLAVADGNIRAGLLASAVIAINRYPAEALFTMPRERTAELLREAERLREAGSEDLRLDALLAAARAWEHGARRIGADAELAAVAVEAARRAGDPVLIAGALDASVVSAGNAGRLREARGYGIERLELVRPLPRHEPYAAAEIVDAYHVVSTTAVATGDLPAALAIIEQAADDPTGDHPYISLPRMIRAYALAGRLDDSIAHADLLWERWQRAGSPPMEWMGSAFAMAALAHGLREDGQFETWQRRACELARVDNAADSTVLAASAAFAEALVALHTAHPSGGPAVLVERAFASFGERWWAPYAQAAGAELAVVASLPDAKARLDQAALAAAENDWAAACLTRARGRLDDDPDALAEAAEAFGGLGAAFEHARTLALLDRDDPTTSMTSMTS